VPEIEYESGHVAKGIGRLVQQYKGKPQLEAFLESILEQVQDFEDAVRDVRLAQTIDGAVELGGGVLLDALGDLVGQPRGGLDDEALVRHIRARIRINKSQGLYADAYAVVRALFPTATLSITPHYPAAFTMAVEGIATTTAEATDAAALLQETAAAGVRTTLLFQETSDALAFNFDGGPGLGFGDATNPATGGAFIGAA
jgi:hypothetical protein